MMDNDKIIDLEMAANAAGGDKDFAKELIGMLITSLAEHEDELNHAHESNDLEALARAAHKLHGAACYTGTPRLKEAAKQLESAAKADKKEHISACQQQLFDEMSLVKTEAGKL